MEVPHVNFSLVHVVPSHLPAFSPHHMPCHSPASTPHHLPHVFHVRVWIPHHHVTIPSTSLYDFPHGTLSVVPRGPYKFHVISLDDMWNISIGTNGFQMYQLWVTRGNLSCCRVNMLASSYAPSTIQMATWQPVGLPHGNPIFPFSLFS
jgi:hypothetical protein